jgi:3-oxoacyl-[acyl-carrier protein] reductase
MGNFDVSGRVAIVTGGNVGIGKSIAATFLQEGASVVTCSRRDYDSPPAAEGLDDDAAKRVVHMTCDVREADQIDAVVPAGLRPPIRRVRRRDSLPPSLLSI